MAAANNNAQINIMTIYQDAYGQWRSGIGRNAISGNISCANFNSPVAIVTQYQDANGTWQQPGRQLGA